MKFSGKFSVSCSSYTYDAYVVWHSSFEEKFSNFSRFTHTPIPLGWWQELLQEYLLFMQNAISHAQLNVLKRIIAMWTSTSDLIGTCACVQEVQFKWILVADLGFFGNVSTPVTFEMHLSRRVWALLRQVKTNSLFFSRWMFISDRDGIINLHQVPTSQQAADIDDNRPMALPWPFFSVLRRLYQHRLRPGLSLPTLLLYSAWLNDIGHECEFRKHDCLMHVGMVVLKAFDDDTRMWTRQQSSLLDKKWWRVPSCVLLAYLFFQAFPCGCGRR